MTRINLSNLNASSEMSRSEMSQTIGGATTVCGLELRLVTVRGPFGIKLRLPKPVVVCRTSRR